MLSKQGTWNAGRSLFDSDVIANDRQTKRNIDWISKHYKENPTEDEVIEIARAIKETIQ